MHSLNETQKAYDALRAKGLVLNIARGKPAPEQLDLAAAMLSLPGKDDYFTEAGDDARNYGGSPQGLIELRRIFAPVFGVPPEQIVAGGNTSLGMMHDVLVWALLRGVPGGQGPWVREPGIAVICPSPGYERHHELCASYGVELLPVAVTGDGPDMSQVEALAKNPRVKGMWCVPTHANPTGETYTDEVVRRLAEMPTGASDFRLFWDDAYAVHHLDENTRNASNILAASKVAGHPERAFVFGSTAKITLAGSAVGFFAASEANVSWYLSCAARRGQGHDKLNQLRHVRFLKSTKGLYAHMAAQREILGPKMKAVTDALSRHLGDQPVSWSVPKGGYFVSVETSPATAARAVALAAEAGVILTIAGSTWPHGHDPDDTNIRIAPSFASLDEVKTASEIVAISILLAVLQSKKEITA